MSESAAATYEWNQLPWRKLEIAVFKLERRIYKASQAGDVNSPSGQVLMTRARSTEEPCAANVARTVLETSGGSDPLAEFNRPLRRAVLWRRRSFGTQSAAGSQFVECILTAVTTLRQQQRDVLEYLTAACAAAIRGEQAPSLLPSGRPAPFTS